RDHGRGAPVEPGGVGPADLQIPDTLAQRAEPAIGFIVEVGGQIARGTERQVDALVEVLPGLTVAADHLVGDHVGQELPQPIAEFPVLGGQLDAGEIHESYSRASVLIAVSVVRSGRISASCAKDAISSPSSVCTAPRTYDMPAPTWVLSWLYSSQPVQVTGSWKLTDIVIGAVDTVRCDWAVPIPLWARIVVEMPRWPVKYATNALARSSRVGIGS